MLVKRILQHHEQQLDASGGEAVVDRWLLIARDLHGPIRPAIGDADLLQSLSVRSEVRPTMTDRV